jgi:uncharacterized membrane protein YccC
MQSPVMPVLRDYWSTDRGRLINACKTALALVIGMGICMRLELATPRTTMVSIVIVMANQQVGMAIARGVYRLIGMLTGCIVGLFLVVYFSQSFAAFYIVLAYWIACCVGGAFFYRNYQSYGFVLAGYATAIVAVPAWANPYGIIDNVIYTLTEVTIAVVTGSAVSALIFPQRVGEALFASCQRHCTHLIAAFRSLLTISETSDDLDNLHVKLTSERTEIDALRSAAIYEDPELRERTPLLREITSEFLDVTTTIHATKLVRDKVLQSLPHPERDASLELVQWIKASIPDNSSEQDLSAQDIKEVEVALKACLAQMPRHVEDHERTLLPPDKAGSTNTYRPFATILQEAVGDLALYLRYFSVIREPMSYENEARLRLPTGIRYVSTANRLAAVVAGVRAMIVIALVAAAWYISGWDDGSTAVTGAAITSALFAIFPSPSAASRNIFVGAVLGSAVACLYTFVVLPHLDGFPTLAASVAPIIMLGSYLASFPRIAPIGIGFNVYFCYVANITNPIVYDPTVQLDAGFAFCTGIGMAVLAFGLIMPPGSAWIGRFYVRQMRRMVSLDACRSPIDPQALHRFESGIRDYIAQINSSSPLHSPTAEMPKRWGFAALDVGSSVLKVKILSDEHRDAAPPPWQSMLPRWQEAIAILFDAVSPDHHLRALEVTQEAVTYLGNEDIATSPFLARIYAYVRVVQIELTNPTSPLRPAEGVVP